MHAVRITVIAPECLRIEYAPQGGFVDLPSLFAVHGPMGNAPVDAPWRDMRTTGAYGGAPPIILETERVRIEYHPDGRPPHAGNMRALIAHPHPPGDVPRADGRVLWTPGARNIHNLGGTLTTLDGLRGEAPLGDGLLARDGWSLIDDSRMHLLVDGRPVPREDAGFGGNTDWYLFAYGADYRAALGALATIAGGVPLPRRCALGSWFSRYWPYTSAEFRGIVEEYHAHGFPLDVMVLDMDWHREGWTGWSWNRELIPDPEDLLSWMHAQSLAVTLNLHPADGVGPHEDRYAGFMRALGREPDGSRVPFDAGNSAYMRALFDEVHRPLERGSDSTGQESSGGVDFWWLDWQQDEYARSVPGLTNLRWLNHLYFQHTQREPGTLGPSDPGRRGLSFSRWAGLGDHRHPVHFSGDAHTGWPMLAFQVRMTAVAGNVGCFYWSHDIGGHFGPRFEEATTRWIQFGALSPVLRLHSARTAVLDRRPWTYEERFCDAMRAAFHLRSRLFPTIASAAAESSQRTVPLLRPMYIDYGHRDLAYRVPHQYMLGDDLLVAPIIEPGLGERCVAARHVYFPGGKDGACFDLETGEKYAAESEAFVAAPIDRVPIFARAGTPILMRPVSMRMTSEPIRELIIRCFPGIDGQVGHAQLIEDDGVSLAHTRGLAAHTPVQIRWSSAASDHGVPALRALIRVGPTTGSYADPLESRAFTIELGGTAVVIRAQSDGQNVNALPDATCAELWRILISERSIRECVEVEITFRPSDSAHTALLQRAANCTDAIGQVVHPDRLRETVAASCRADASSAPDPERVRRLLSIGAGIGVHAQGDLLRLIDTHAWIDRGAATGEIIDRQGERSSVVAALDLSREGNALWAQPRLSPLKPPALGQRATRLARYRFTLDGVPIVLDHAIETRLRPITCFRAIGPYPWDWRHPITDQVFDVETSAAAPHHASIPAQGGDKWPVDFRRTFPDRSGLAYAHAALFSTRRQQATLHLDSSDKLEAWLNGHKIFSQDGSETHAAAAGCASVTLEPGRNTLLIKCSEGGGGWGFTAAFEAAHALTADSEEHTPPPMVG